VDPLTVAELHAEIERFIRAEGHALILNVNAHGLNLSYQDVRLRKLFNSAEIVFCDGVGVMLAARMLGERIPERITYADWMWELAAFAEQEGFSLYFLGGRPGFAEATKVRLQQRFHDLRVVGVRHGYFDRTVGGPENEAVIQEINEVAPDILIVGFGMPLQEIWLRENWDRVNAKVALTGGAVFGYVGGKLVRGPAFLVRNGFEWLARLLVEPRRLWRRYIVGNPLFLLRVLVQRLDRALRWIRGSEDRP
jgi:N-acetylglucosaminyldiphosphoundecaprenol N-acetyl-beta-D-mannosaminyltransferase